MLWVRIPPDLPRTLQLVIFGQESIGIMAARSRYVFLLIVAAAVLFGAVLAHAMAWGFERSAIADMAVVGRQLYVSHLVGYGAAALVGSWAWLSPRPHTLCGEVVDELQRVSWPSREETRHATVVVLICVVVSAAALGIFDGVWLAFTGLLFGRPTTSG